MNNDEEIERQLLEELEGYDEAVVRKIRSLTENRDLEIDIVTEYSIGIDDYDIKD